jgi:hypothetical protein
VLDLSEYKHFNVHHISSLQKIVSIVKNRSNLKVIDMILFPEDDILIREIESWKGFADMLCSEDRRLFLQMLNDCHRYSNAINAKENHSHLSFIDDSSVYTTQNDQLVNKISI